MGLQYTPYTLIAMFAAVVSAVLAGIIWKRRPGRGVISFVILMLAVLEWTVLGALEIAVIDLDTKIALSILTYFGIGIVPAGWMTFVLEYTGRERWLTRRNLILLAIEPISIILIVAT